MNSDTVLDHPTLLALAEVLSPSLNGKSSFRLAQAAETINGVGWELLDEPEAVWMRDGLQKIPSTRVAHWSDELARLRENGVNLVAVFDAAYPSNLRMVHNRPPLLFVRGSISVGDERAIAIVGTREPSEEGTRAARQIAGELAELDVTVVSGLAQGVDTAAHLGALDARGRTIAVFGTGINKVFPARNGELARRIPANGACVSQFWPDQGGSRWSFPVRNLVTSGLAIGTVVVEAGETSGARIQAEEALRHGKRLFLLKDLVAAQPWARAAAEREGVLAVTSADEMIEAIEVELAHDAAMF